MVHDYVLVKSQMARDMLMLSVLWSTARGTKPDGKESLRHIFYSLYMPTLLHTSWNQQPFLFQYFLCPESQYDTNQKKKNHPQPEN